MLNKRATAHARVGQRTPRNRSLTIMTPIAGLLTHQFLDRRCASALLKIGQQAGVDGLTGAAAAKLCGAAVAMASPAEPGNVSGVYAAIDVQAPIAARAARLPR